MSIAFKEWAIVCAALGRGEQSIILRKGGIAEGRDGFRFQHPEFYLFPTLFHEQVEKTILPAGTPIPSAEAGLIRIEFLVRVEWTAFVNSLETARMLATFHIWRGEVVTERFDYDEPKGLSLAFVRVERLARRWEFADAPKYGGCRSWVNIPDVPCEVKTSPVLGNAVHQRRDAALRALVGEVVSS